LASIYYILCFDNEIGPTEVDFFSKHLTHLVT
jgi:hypothetical protein